ncbi:MAG TPA: hypothetical protein VKA83_01505 [Methylomirabilota bacterium]|nr:hypothetical protein [Methylomirabilota bacterium]
MRHALIALLLAVALTGCTSTSKSIIITGDALVSLATQFDAVSRHMTQACVAKQYTVATCDAYRTFGEKFKQAYPATKTLWGAATQFEDKGLAAAAQDSFAKLAADLQPFLAMIGGK